LAKEKTWKVHYFLVGGLCKRFLSPPHGKIDFSGVPDVEQILIRVKQIQANYVLIFGKKNSPEVHYLLSWGTLSQYLIEKTTKLLKLYGFNKILPSNTLTIANRILLIFLANNSM